MFNRSLGVPLALGVLGILVLVGVLIPDVVCAQVTTATFHAIVTDPSGAAVPGATVALNHVDTNASVTKTSDAVGEAGFDFLRVGNYTLRIEAAGFKAYQGTGIELAAGENVRRKYLLELGLVTEVVNVDETAPIVDTVTAEQRENIPSFLVTQLPLARRNYTNLLAMGTGVSLVKDNNGSFLRMNGLGRNGTSVAVDGTDAIGNGEMRSFSMLGAPNYIDTLSIEAIQEVQTVKGVTTAEYGQTLGGNVNLITKSGTNQIHGSLFENFQAEDLNARNPFLNAKVPLTFNQFGGSFGGPIKRDRIFIFGVYEGYRERAFQQVSGNTPTMKLREEAILAVPAYKPALDSLPLPNQPHSPNADVGFFLGAGGSSASEDHAVVKGDIRVGNSGNMALTYTRGRPSRRTPRFEVANDRAWSGTQDRVSASFVTGGAAWSGETRFGYNRLDLDRLDMFWDGGLDPANPETVLGGRRTPSIRALGFRTSSSELVSYFGPIWTLEQKYARTAGRHSLKFGGRYSHRAAGRFDVENAELRYENKADLLANTPSRVQATFGVNRHLTSSYELGFFSQDDWRISPKLVLNLGVRYDFFSKAVARPTGEEPASLFNLDGLLDDRFTFGPFRDPLDPYNDDGGVNLAPRISFSYNPDGNGANVIRGGFGVMFSPLMWSSNIRSISASKTLPFRAILSRQEAQARGFVFPVFNQDAAPIIESAGQVQIPVVIDPNIQAPYAMNLFLGVQRALAPSLMLETAFAGNRGVKFPMTRIFNKVDRVTGLRPNPALGEGDYIDNSQNTVYLSWQTSLRQRYSRNLTGNIHYTWAKALSYTGGDIGATSNGDSQYTTQDFFNWRADRGPSTGDIIHYLAADWVYELPGFEMLRNAFARQAIGGWQVSTIFTASTGAPLLITLPSALRDSRPDYLGGDPINGNYRDTLQYLNPAAFGPVPKSTVSGATLRPGNLGNGAVRGPGTWNVDLSLGKSFRITEGLRLQFRADMINAFNHTNLVGVSTNFEASNFGRLTDTLGARVIQLNTRLTW